MLYAIISVLLLAAIYVGTQFRHGIRRARAANNVVAALATFSTLGSEAQAEVARRAESIVRKSNWPEATPVTFGTDVARWGWYALAMNELGISPACLTSHWSIVRNPFTALLVTDTMLDSAIALAQKAGYQISLDRKPGVFELLVRK